MNITLKAQLVARTEKINGYQTLIFKDIRFKDSYVMTTLFPNWDIPTIQLGDIGYIKYREVIAGKDTWYDYKTNSNVYYKNTDCHLLDFVHEPKIDNLLNL